VGNGRCRGALRSSGLGGFGALDPDSTGRVHNGADDNASGTAALLEIGRLLARRHPARTVVLVAFSGEELGTIGSSYFVHHSEPQPIDSLYAMLNLDMVGRLRNARLLALGAGTAREFPALLDSLNTMPRFDLQASGDGWGPSDHAVFFATHHPVLHFFTDLHGIITARPTTGTSSTSQESRRSRSSYPVSPWRWPIGPVP